MSRALGISKKSWSTYAKETLSIVEAICMWRSYLLGKKLFIQTDQRSLKYFLKQRVTTPKQQKWVAKLLGYDYGIIYWPRCTNSASDALSCKLGSPILNNIFIPQVDIWEEIKEVVIGDPYMETIGQLTTENPVVPYT